MNIKGLLFILTIALLAQANSSLADNKSKGSELNKERAVVVIEGGGNPHPFTSSWATCNDRRPDYIQSLVDAGLPVFTAPGFGNLSNSTQGRTGCPPQPPVEVQWNTAGFPKQAGQAVLGFLGYLYTTYGYKTFDLVGYSYGGVIARATVAALKQQPPADSMAHAFSYAQIAVEAGISIPSIITMNSPHFGGPAYDIAADPRKYLGQVRKSWGKQYANSSRGLIEYERLAGAGAIHVLSTTGHAVPGPANWDEQQVGMLNDVKLTLMAGDYCGRKCPLNGPDPSHTPLRTDGTVPVYSQLMEPCPTSPCPSPPKSVFIPPGLLPERGVTRKTFPTIHSTYDTTRLGLEPSLSVSKNPTAIDFMVNTVLATWREAGIPLFTK